MAHGRTRMLAYQMAALGAHVRLFCVFLCHLSHFTIFWLVCVPRRGLDLVNVHLFHDASNLIACEASPSIYSANRQNALRYVINRSDLELC